MKRICLLSQAAKACKIPTKKLHEYIQESVGHCLMVESLGEIHCWATNIASDIKENREILEAYGPKTIPNMKAFAAKLNELAAWMKSNGFTHFIEDIWFHEI